MKETYIWNNLATQVAFITNQLQVLKCHVDRESLLSVT